MPIVDARAINYEQMKDFCHNHVMFETTSDLMPHTKTYFISITDPGIKSIFDSEYENFIAFTYKDFETNYRQSLNEFIPCLRSQYHMTESDASKIVSFIFKAEADPEQVLLIVNCMYGQCRSGAIVDFVSTIFGFGCHNTKERNPQIIPNKWNQFLLFQEYFRKAQ